MDAWGAWFGGMGAAVIDGGNPVGKSSTVKPDGALAAGGGEGVAGGLLGKARADRAVVEDAEAHRSLGFGVMSGRAHGAEGVGGLAGHHLVDGVDCAGFACHGGATQARPTSSRGGATGATRESAPERPLLPPPIAPPMPPPSDILHVPKSS